MVGFVYGKCLQVIQVFYKHVYGDVSTIYGYFTVERLYGYFTVECVTRHCPSQRWRLLRDLYRGSGDRLAVPWDRQEYLLHLTTRRYVCTCLFSLRCSSIAWMFLHDAIFV